MAILDVFKKEKGEDKADAKPVKKARATEKKAASAHTAPSGQAQLLIKPYVTEKTTVLADGQNIFTFKVASGANKAEISKAIKSLYNVTPRKIAIINLPKKYVFSRGHMGVKSGVKKALVYLKKGDTIEFA